MGIDIGELVLGLQLKLELEFDVGDPIDGGATMKSRRTDVVGLSHPGLSRASAFITAGDCCSTTTS